MPVPRFTDEKLQQFYEEFVQHAEVVDQRHEDLCRAIRENAEATHELAKATSGLLDAWNATQGAVRVAAAVGNALKWLAGIGAGLAAVIYSLKTGAWK